MKKLKVLFCIFAFISILLLSCNNNSNKEISIKPKTTEIKGDLSDYFEVVDKEYKIPIKESSFEQQIAVEIKRKDKDFPFDTDKINPFGTSGGEEYHVGFGIEFLGENGPVQINNATEGGLGGPYSDKDVSGLFLLKKSETGYIRWTVNKTEGIKTFQITSALQKEDGTSLSTTSANPREFKGSVNNSYPIEMSLNFETRNVSGKYFYVKQKINIDLKGNVDNSNNLILKEHDIKGALTGTFNGKLEDNVYSGNWTNPNETKSYPFSVSEQNPSFTTSENIETESNQLKNTNKSNTNWDKMIDDYDSYVTEYVKFYKKIQKGDNSVMTDYSTMMEKATSLQTSLAKAQTDNSLTGKQAARMLKIQAKMLKGIQPN